MDKELKIVLKRLNMEKYDRDKPVNFDNVDCEVLVMNYNDDLIFENNAEISNIPKEEAINYTEAQDIVKFEDEELCDVDTKQNVLVKFEKNISDAKKEKEENNTKSDSAKKKLVCHQCGFKAKKKHHLQSHIIQAHNNKKATQTEFSCEYCMFKTKWKYTISPHMARFHMDKVQTDGPSESEQKKSCYNVQGTNVMDHCTLDKNNVLLCNYCSHTALRRELMMSHIPVHIVDKSEVLQCPKCPKKFIKNVLQVHLYKVHNPEGTYNCPKCLYSTKWKNNLQRHIKQNKDNEMCKPVQKRKCREQMHRERLEGKAPPVKKRKTINNETDTE